MNYFEFHIKSSFSVLTGLFVSNEIKYLEIKKSINRKFHFHSQISIKDREHFTSNVRAHPFSNLIHSSSNESTESSFLKKNLNL